MPQQQFNLKNLQNLDFGVINSAFEDAVSRATSDCLERPEDKSARKVTLTFIMKPMMKNGDLDSIDTAVDFAVSIPKQKTRIYSMEPKTVAGKPSLYFHPDLPDEPNGATIMDRAGEDD